MIVILANSENDDKVYIDLRHVIAIEPLHYLNGMGWDIGYHLNSGCYTAYLGEVSEKKARELYKDFVDAWMEAKGAKA